MHYFIISVIISEHLEFGFPRNRMCLARYVFPSHGVRRQDPNGIQRNSKTGANAMHPMAETSLAHNIRYKHIHISK